MKKNKLKVQSELATIYITSDGGKYIDKTEALYAESQVQKEETRKRRQLREIMDTVELIMRVLKLENWGVFYKNQPMQSLEMQDGIPLYKVNQVDENEIEKAIKRTLTCEENTQISYQNSNQNKNSKSG